jgi:hypothetical protein
MVKYDEVSVSTGNGLSVEELSAGDIFKMKKIYAEGKNHAKNKDMGMG